MTYLPVSQAAWLRRTVEKLSLVACLASCITAVHAADLKPVPASLSSVAEQAPMLAAAWAGKRAVAVGEHGIVLLSDDEGVTWRQARSVPVSFMLTSVSFADAKLGWAVGHGGVVLVTRDGGETWTQQRISTDEDRPLFAVHFFDARHGVAVGLWSLVLVTSDGGEHWRQQALEPMPGANKADLNLLNLFAGPKGSLFATAERGQVLRSDDAGASWSYLATGYKGSLWSGAVLPDGAMLVGGQRGTLLRSDDHGVTWAHLPLSSKNSITAIAADARGVTLVGLDGLMARSNDGRSFIAMSRPDGVGLNAALRPAAGAGASVILLTRRGVARSDERR